jgi:uncharacterized membrane protein YcaP (DUF421 family)
MFLDNWENLVRVVLIGTLAYAGTVVLLRISGNRTLSKMNSFDLVVTIAFGSALATVLLNRNVSLSEGLAALALLVFLQFLVTWLSVRSTRVSRLVKTKPALLLRDGRFQPSVMKAVRITEEEICASVRQHGLGGIEQVAAVILESDGSLSVIGKQQAGSMDALKGVAGAGRKPE